MRHRVTADQHLLAESCDGGIAAVARVRQWLFGPRQWHHPRRDHHPHQRHPHDIGEGGGDQTTYPLGSCVTPHPNDAREDSSWIFRQNAAFLLTSVHV